jgi:hypothetical protein
MSLIESVFDICEKLPDDWAALLKTHGLDIRQPNAAKLEEILTTTPLTVNRDIRGFADFADDVAFGIVPGRPAHSLLYHALASPNVQTAVDGQALSRFPSLDDIEVVENYVFGVVPPTLDQLVAQTIDGKLALVVFAYEYRPASQTCHHKHADLTFARTGSARVGTQPARYMPGLRGFVQESDGDPFAIHVAPARYGLFLSAQMPGDAQKFRPMRFENGDAARKFWVPLHKLFDGTECLKGADEAGLKVNWSGVHVNEKLFRLHRALGATPPNEPPYRVTAGLANVVASGGGAATVLPAPHPLVEPAQKADGTPLTFVVPGTFNGGGPGAQFTTLSTSLSFKESSAPSYAHVRTEIRNGRVLDLNQDDPSLKSDAALLQKVQRGGYTALNYSDFTAEGWVTAGVTGFGGLIIAPTVHAAYSLVSAPDFYPACDQRELTEWTGSSAVPRVLQRELWGQKPDTLCDQRLPANLQLKGTPFSADETTVTALVSLLTSTPKGADLAAPAAARHSHLPDDCAGLFAPGWDVSSDNLSGVDHLAGYSLGSPFPEDAKLCAALSTFWPAVAPDATREMQPVTGNQSGTVSPMTDEEIGIIGGMPWDGVPGPTIVDDGGQRFVDFASFNRVDYVRNALQGLFTMRLTARVAAPEYQQRVLALALMYSVLHAERTGAQLQQGELRDERRHWVLLSFRAINHGDPELSQAQADSGLILHGPVYRAVLFPPAPLQTAPDFLFQRMPLKDQVLLLADPLDQRVLVRGESESRWRRGLL